MTWAADHRVARALDRDIAPVFHDRFATLLWRHLPPLGEGLVLDVHAGSGRTTTELLKRLPSECRVIALEPSEAARGLARTRIEPRFHPRVYLKGGNLSDMAAMAEGSCALMVANLVLGEAHDVRAALRGMLRVVKPGGTLLATAPMRDSWTEAEDLFRDVLLDAGLTRPADRLRRIARLRPRGADWARLLETLGYDPDEFVIEQERFKLLFRSGREFLFSPLVELGPLRLWRAAIGQDGNAQELFYRLKESIDAYFKGRVFAINVTAGLLAVRKSGAPLARPHWDSLPTLDRLFRRAEHVDEVPIVLDDDEPAPFDPEPLTADDDEALDRLLEEVLEFKPREVEPRRVPRVTLQGVKAVMNPPSDD